MKFFQFQVVRLCMLIELLTYFFQCATSVMYCIMQLEINVFVELNVDRHRVTSSIMIMAMNMRMLKIINIFAIKS